MDHACAFAFAVDRAREVIIGCRRVNSKKTTYALQSWGQARGGPDSQRIKGVKTAGHDGEENKLRCGSVTGSATIRNQPDASRCWAQLLVFVVVH